MLLLYQRFTQPLSQLELPIESDQSQFEFEKPSENEVSVYQPLDLSEEMQQIKQVYYLERRLFL